jgi:acetyl-CoA acyltransferase 1
MSQNRIASIASVLAASASANRSEGLKTKLTAGAVTVGTKDANDVVIVSALRTAIGKAGKGAFKDTTPDTLLRGVLRATMERTGVKHEHVGDVCVGNVQMAGSYAGPGRMAMFEAGFPETVPMYAVNRQCSSGLQACANIAASIKMGIIDSGIGAGVESMSFGGGVKDMDNAPPIDFDALGECALAKDCLVPMGVTSEIVAERYGITREEQDRMAEDSHRKSLEAQAEGRFRDEIVPLTVTWTDPATEDDKEITVDKDDGPREGSTADKLAKLRPAFKAGGSTTAGNSSQVSDGAAAVLLMRRSFAEKQGYPVLGTFRAFQCVGVKPDEMGVGPAEAIPAVLDQCGIGVGDIDVFEINEAFASQATYCIKKLGIPPAKLNPNGGAIALGHPLGMTGARMIATLLHQLRRTKQKLGVVSMCIGTGMGAAAVIEAE